MEKLKKTFRNKTIFITGHTGFKGSWLTLWLNTLGAKIIGISKDIPTKPSFFGQAKLGKEIIDLRLDLTNLSKLKLIFTKYKPDFIFHLAAQSLVKESYNNPVRTFQSNTIGTLNVLECIRNLKKRCVSIIITSDKSYKNLELRRGYRENDILGGKDPYSASKASAELVIQSYVNSFLNTKSNNKLIAIARAGNVIGGGDWSKNRLLPDCVKAWSKNKTAKIRNPKSTRPWQHVLEALRGYLNLAVKLNKRPNLHGEAFNFGPKNSQNKTVSELLIQTKKNWKNIKWKIIKTPNSKFESKLLKLNSNKAEQKLNWKPILKFDDSIKMVINWYKKYYFNKNNDINEFSKEQLKVYLHRIEKKI